MRKRPQNVLITLSLATAFILASACSPGKNDSAEAKVPTVKISADTIYRGGPIVTIDDSNPTAEAVAVRAGKIIAVGSESKVMAWRGEGTEVVDLGGKTLLPGFIDAHGHVFNTGLQALAANLLSRPDGSVNAIAELQRNFSDWMVANPDGFALSGWVIGFGYDDSQLQEQRHPTRDDLDKVSLTLPVLAIHQSGHLAAINSKGLELAGVSADSADPAGGVFRRYEGSSEPDGVLEEMAFFQIVFSILGELGSDENKAMLVAGIDLYASFGYTTAQEGRATAEAVATEVAVASAGELKMDVVAYPDIQLAADTIKPPQLSMAYDQHFRIGGAKLSLDGSPQGKTAWLTKPYHVPPLGQAVDYRGYPAVTDEQAIAYVDQAFASGWQILAHCNGDAAADQFIMAVRAATEKYGEADRRTVMIHAQTVREDQLDAMKELRIIPSFFGMHTYYWGDWHRDSVLGPERAARISPAASALERGMIYTQHHDAPVALPNSMVVLASQVNRTTRSGQVLGAEQRVSVMDALKSITINAAYQHFEEQSKGSLEPGKLADFVILDKNPLKVDPMAIKDIKVVETIKEGRSIYVMP
jgi:predicted amidohydrolase YtcJ